MPSYILPSAPGHIAVFGISDHFADGLLRNAVASAYPTIHFDLTESDPWDSWNNPSGSLVKTGFLPSSPLQEGVFHLR